MIKLTNVYIPNSTRLLKFTDNSDSEDITERSDSEDSNNDMTASALFQGIANWNLENDQLNTLLGEYKVSSIDASDLKKEILKNQHNYNKQKINIWENRSLSIDECRFLIDIKNKRLTLNEVWFIDNMTVIHCRKII